MDVDYLSKAIFVVIDDFFLHWITFVFFALDEKKIKIGVNVTKNCQKKEIESRWRL